GGGRCRGGRAGWGECTVADDGRWLRSTSRSLPAQLRQLILHTGVAGLRTLTGGREGTHPGGEAGGERKGLPAGETHGERTDERVPGAGGVHGGDGRCGDAVLPIG